MKWEDEKKRRRTEYNKKNKVSNFRFFQLSIMLVSIKKISF
jgi:hypothetical protein